MIDRPVLSLMFAAAIGSGLIAGVFFAFSSFVMPALRRLPAAQGVAAMQSINIMVLNPMFLGVFLGTAIGCLLLVVIALLNWHKPGATCLGAGGAIYLLGTFAVTALFNVPRNDALAALDPANAESVRLWAEYVAGWTLWNHVRTIAAIAATILLMIAIWTSSARGTI
ncbi:MAG: hypothetical protein DME65_00700 [Verrucomicrobia bacterium]|nr:MAG: hypothetical protein DME65_00700 [Verrucomicrobiota bacterium]